MKKIVSFLHEHQNNDGSFDTYSSSDPSFKKYSRTKTTFINSLILELLCKIKDPPKEIQKIQASLATYILNQKSTQWTWNYWDRDSKHFTQKPFPDDADDTFAALNALYAYDPQCIGGEALAHIVTGLTLIEHNEGGPYETWYTTSEDSNWHDIDIAVNTRILRFMNNQDISLPHVEKFVKDSLQNISTLSSQYYPSNIPILYEMFHVLEGEYTLKIQDHFLKLHDLSRMHRAFQRLILLERDIEQKKFMGESFKTISPMCFDPVKDENTYFAGAPTLTAAATLAATSVEINSRIKKKHSQNRLKSMQEMLIDSIRKECLALPSPISKATQNAVSKMGDKALKDPHIILLPYFFLENCAGGDPGAFDEKIMKLLCKAHFYGWCAYTAYDDILDDDSDYKALNVANIFLEKCIHAFYEATPPSFHKSIRDILHLIDNSMYWERHNAWIPISKQLTYHDNVIAQKSYGHMLAPLAILHMQGYTSVSSEYQSTQKFFHHYILARQLGDDAHDWEDDIKSGYLNPVAFHLFNLNDLSKPVTQDLIDTAHEVFWEEIVLDVCTQIDNHCNKAEAALRKMSFLHNTEMFQKLISEKRTMIEQTREQQKKAHDFIKTYSQI